MMFLFIAKMKYNLIVLTNRSPRTKARPIFSTMPNEYCYLFNGSLSRDEFRAICI